MKYDFFCNQWSTKNDSLDILVLDKTTLGPKELTFMSSGSHCIDYEFIFVGNFCSFFSDVTSQSCHWCLMITIVKKRPYVVDSQMVLC